MKRFHVHAHVEDLQASIAFYSKLFAAPPARTNDKAPGSPGAREVVERDQGEAEVVLHRAGERRCARARGVVGLGKAIHDSVEDGAGGWTLAVDVQ